MPADVHLRPAAISDLSAVHAIEQAAGELFRAVGMDDIADDPEPTIDTLRQYQAAGRMWVAIDGETVVGYLMADVLTGSVHIEQVSVHPDHMRRGIGRTLIEYLAEWALQQHRRALTLTTFVNVPWNAPYYAKLGFRMLPHAQQSLELRAIREHERAIGLDKWPRAVMLRNTIDSATQPPAASGVDESTEALHRRPDTCS